MNMEMRTFPFLKRSENTNIGDKCVESILMSQHPGTIVKAVNKETQPPDCTRKWTIRSGPSNPDRDPFGRTEPLYFRRSMWFLHCI